MIFIRYIVEIYSKYSIFMDGTASVDVDNFLKSGEDELSFFGKVSSQLMFISSFMSASIIESGQAQVTSCGAFCGEEYCLSQLHSSGLQGSEPAACSQSV